MFELERCLYPCQTSKVFVKRVNRYKFSTVFEKRAMVYVLQVSGYVSLFAVKKFFTPIYLKTVAAAGSVL